MKSRLAKLCISSLAVVGDDCWCAMLSRPKSRRTPQKLARPPKWSADVLDTFFPDARTKLVGTRPDYDKPQLSQGSQCNAEAPRKRSRTPEHTAGDGWSKLIDAETIETEIKRLGQEVAKNVTDAAPSSKAAATKIAAANSACWPRSSPWPPSTMATSAGKTRPPSLRDAVRQGRAQLQSRHRPNLSRSHPAQARPGRPDRRQSAQGIRRRTKADWSQVADRPPLMQRLNIAQQDRLQKWLASKAEFTAHRDDIKHESQLAATIADIITHEGFEYWDDETYAQYRPRPETSRNRLGRRGGTRQLRASPPGIWQAVESLRKLP